MGRVTLDTADSVTIYALGSNHFNSSWQLLPHVGVEAASNNA